MTLDEIKETMAACAPVIREYVATELTPLVKRLEALEQRLEFEKAMRKPRVRVAAGSAVEGLNHDEP